jgi:hypothetical protein
MVGVKNEVTESGRGRVRTQEGKNEWGWQGGQEDECACRVLGCCLAASVCGIGKEGLPKAVLQSLSVVEYAKDTVLAGQSRVVDASGQ